MKLVHGNNAQPTNTGEYLLLTGNVPSVTPFLSAFLVRLSLSRLSRDRGQFVTLTIYPLGEPAPPGQGESPFPVDFYLSWMSRKLPGKLPNVLESTAIGTLGNECCSGTTHIQGVTLQTDSKGQPLLLRSPQIGMDSRAAPRGSFEDEGQRLKACEENLRRYHQLALAGRLVGATMHEVNNRLAALTNLIFLARIHPGCSPQSVEYLDEADNQLRSLGEITSRSLAFIRLDTEAKEIDLVDLATSALRLHHEQISKMRINVQIRSCESALAWVKKGEILQVVTNLLLNAIEALAHSGNLHVRVAMHGPDAIITIADNGAGIPESMRGTLFDSFKSNKSEGNGLGLWIVREIVHGHGGTIQYRSSSVVGRSGTIFRISLPTQSLARAPSPEES